MAILKKLGAEYYTIPYADQNTTKVPDSVSDEHAILISDIMSTGFGAIERGEAGLGSSVAIFAQGPVGLMATAGARALGCGLIIGVDTMDDRLEISKQFGANGSERPAQPCGIDLAEAVLESPEPAPRTPARPPRARAEPDPEDIRMYLSDFPKAMR